MLKYKVMEWNMENGFILIKLKAERVKIIGNWNERNLLTMLSSFFSSVVREIAKEKDLNEDEALDFVIGCVREAHWKL